MLLEDPLDFVFGDAATLVLVQLFEDILQIHFCLDQRRLQTTGQKFTIVYLPILICVDVIHHFLQLRQISVLVLLLQRSLKLVHCQVSVRICVDLLE